MKIVVLRGKQCPDRVSCPHVYRTDHGTLVVQGYVSTELACKPGEVVVEIPLALLPEAAAHQHVDLYLTSNSTVLVRGPKVVDPEALAAIQLPENEDVVEVALGVLPDLEAAL